MSRLIIEAGKNDKYYWLDLWRYRELFYFLAWRDTLVRYKQMVIGIGWALIRPLFSVVVFTVVFGRVARLPADGVPYPLLVFAGMLPWQFFATSLTESSSSLVANANLISKVYFPRLVVPASSVVVCFVDSLVSMIILSALLVWYKFTPSWHLLALPMLLAHVFLTALGPGLLLAALNVQYRDFRYIIPFAVQCGIYISPVGFTSGAIPQRWRLLYSLNPMVGVIDEFRWSICGLPYLDMLHVSISIVFSVFALVIGVIYFRRVERTFADLV